MSKKKILVTGATGYLGAKIVLHLKQQGYQVIGLCRTVTDLIKEKFEGIELIQLDLTVQGAYDALEQIEDIHTIIHTVSLDHHQSQRYPLQVVNATNIFPTWELLNRFSKKNVTKFIYLSTLHVLGKLPNCQITETYPASPENVYALTHLIGENIVHYYHRMSPMQCINLRLSNGYGAPIFKTNNCWWLVINDLCKMAFFEKKIVLQSDGTALRDFIHISDTVQILQLLIESDNLKENLFNVSSGDTYSILEIAHRIRAVYESKYGLELPIYRNRTELSMVLPPKINKFLIEHRLLNDLGFCPKMSLKAGIEELFNYFESDPQNGAAAY
jgi:nucleoside-diphosphate-sugar epimerase